MQHLSSTFVMSALHNVQERSGASSFMLVSRFDVFLDPEDGGYIFLINGR
jgi:hypothetical protein